MINIIVAVDRNYGIGKDNQLLAHIKPDLEYFKQITLNHPIIMGYNTYESLPIKPLPNRDNIVLTSRDIVMDGVRIFNDIDSVLSWIKDTNQDVFIIGGQRVYEQFMPLADKLYITHIFDEFKADSHFPIPDDSWEIESSICSRENINHKHPHIFTVYSRKH